MKGDFDVKVDDVLYGCDEAVSEFQSLIRDYVESMDPGTNPMTEEAFKEKASEIIKSLFERVDNLLDYPTIAHAALIELKRLGTGWRK